ncbi:MAG: type IV secretion system protein [Candidatus Omnitrophica bacterium]|nr:type IV secretion system protein [Candidatus Omnitrophota bacterium]
MDFIISVINSDLAGMIDLGRVLLSSLFIISCFVMYLRVFQNKANWTALIIRLIIGFLLLQNYSWIMDTTKDIVVGLDQVINPDQSAANQYVVMSQNMQTVYENNQQKGFSLALFGKKTLHNLVINLSFIFYSIVSNVMQAIRYSIVAIVYKLGPILIPFIVFDATKRIVQGWYTSYIAVLSWPILWHIVLSIAVALSGKIDPTVDGLEKFVMMNFAVCFVLLYSPMIVTSLTYGIGTGIAASMAGIGAVNILTRNIKEGGRVAAKGITGSVDGATGAIASGNFRNVVTRTFSGGLRRVGFRLSSAERSVFKSIKNMIHKKGGTS